jgi:hypothetical protein
MSMSQDSCRGPSAFSQDNSRRLDAFSQGVGSRTTDFRHRTSDDFSKKQTLPTTHSFVTRKEDQEQVTTTITTVKRIVSAPSAVVNQNSLEIWPGCYEITIRQPLASLSSPPQPINTYARFVGKSWFGLGKKDCWKIGAPWWDPDQQPSTRMCFRDDNETIAYLRHKFKINKIVDRSNEDNMI